VSPAAGFQDVSPTILADILGRSQVMDIGIRPLWAPMTRVAGPAFTVRCAPGDNLMLHAAIYRAEPGSILVVEAGDVDYALAGGNVCAIAKRRGHDHSRHHRAQKKRPGESKHHQAGPHAKKLHAFAQFANIIKRSGNFASAPAQQ